MAHHAEIIARSITHPAPQTGSLIALATVLAKPGQIDHARRVAHDAETVARSITDPTFRARALSRTGRRPGQGRAEIDHAHHVAHHAETIARSTTHPTPAEH